MKKLFLMTIVLIAALSIYGQVNFEYKKKIPGGCSSKIDADSFFLIVKIDAKEVSDFLKKTRYEIYRNGDKKPSKSGHLAEWLNADQSKKLSDGTTIQFKRDSLGIENGDSLLIFPFLGKDEKGALISDTLKDRCTYIFKETKKETVDEVTSGRLFIDEKMIRSVQEGACGFICDLDTLINRRRERAYFTDYYIRYDASGIGDDFTICKHIIRRNKSDDSLRYYEGYRRVAPAWFAPSVGSQIKFEVINVGLTDAGKIIVASDDLFLEGAGRFDSFINGKLTTLLGAEGKADSAKNAFEGAGSINLYGKLFEELSEYVLAFKVSACAVESNKKNIMVILARIRKEFKLQGSDVLNELVSKASEDQTSTAIAIKNLIVELGKVRPLVYSTMRARNRDFINIKVMDAQNNEVRNENIRMSYGLKIDFSTGVFLTGLRDFTYGFKDTTVQYQADDPNKMIVDTGKMIIKQDEGKFNLGFGLLVHWYPRMTSNYNVGLACGFMSTSNLDLSVLAGGSVMFSSLFGSNMRVSLNGGIAWGKVSRLNNAYYEGYKEVNGRPVFYNDLNTVPVMETWKHSWFVGATFNFGGARQN